MILGIKAGVVHGCISHLELETKNRSLINVWNEMQSSPEVLKNLLADEKPNPPVGLLILFWNLGAFAIIATWLDPSRRTVKIFKHLVQLTGVFVAHSFGEVFNFEVDLLLVSIVLKYYVDFTLLSVVDCVLNQSWTALSEPQFVSYHHFWNVVA